MQEYADPVIDWLESERKFFSARYYRQHCTFRHGAFIKDLSSVEPDLSKVIILDNSPLSYMFHQGESPIIQDCSRGAEYCGTKLDQTTRSLYKDGSMTQLTTTCNT